ncbi:hypothetical protein ACIA7R_31400 [Micromonospora chalcea]
MTDDLPNTSDLGVTTDQALAGAEQMAEALRAAGWHVTPPDRIVRTGHGMTDQQRARLLQWLRDNNLNPNDIPADARIERGDDTITTEVFVRRDGKVVVDGHAVARTTITVPMTTPWNPQP